MLTTPAQRDALKAKGWTLGFHHGECEEWHNRGIGGHYQANLTIECNLDGPITTVHGELGYILEAAAILTNKEATIHDKAKEAHRLTLEVIAEAKAHPDREFAAVFNTFEDDLSSKAKILVDWTHTLKEDDHA